jgi:uncharacterized protein (TIGR03437 family)
VLRLIFPFLVIVALAQEPTPVITAAGVVNAATFSAGLTPGGLATVFGSGLTFKVNGIILAAGFPMPANLQGTMLMVNGVPAPLTSIANINGTEQINFQAPFELAGSSAAMLQVRNGQKLSEPVTVSVAAFQPGIFTSDGRRSIAVHGAGNALVTSGNPALRGEIIVIYATGLGPVNPPVGTGVAASPQHFTFVSNDVMAFFGGQPATPLFAGLTPGFAGLYQVNVRVPDATPSGDVNLSLEVAGVTSPSVLLAVK